jgi:hypothetical protein
MPAWRNTEYDVAYCQSGAADNNAICPHDSEAKDNATYCNGGMAKDNATHCCGGMADNDSG